MRYFHGSILILVIATLSLLLLGNSQLNHDTSWYLVSTNWWLHGVEIYDQIIELNPPLAFYLTMPPVYVADQTGIDPVFAMKSYLVLIALVSLFWGQSILSRAKQFSVTEVTCLTFLASIALLVIPLASFGQRDHVMVLFAWPYITLALTAPHRPSTAQAILVGLFAALGFAIKPYFLVIPAFITLAQIGQVRSWRLLFSPQNLAVLGFCIFYVGASYILHPAYFSKIIPQTILTYGAYKQDLMHILLPIAKPLLIGLFVLLVVMRIRKTHRNADLILGSATLAGLVSYIVQSKGWGYQAVPMFSFLTLFAGWVAFAAVSRNKQPLVGVFVALVVVVMLIAPAILRGPYSNPVYQQFATYFTCPKGQRSYQTFVSNVYPSFPLANYAHAEPANRAPALWRFPGVARQLAIETDPRAREHLEQLLRVSRDEVISDFLRVKPQIVIVDAHKRKSYFGDVRFSYLDYFLQDARFQRRWGDYNKVGTYAGFDIYRRLGCG